MFYRNLANIASILGVLPIALLFWESGYEYILVIILANLVMDDADGILARKLSIGSEFGANLDNVCDAVAHCSIVFAVAGHHGVGLMITSLIVAAAMLIRLVQRITATEPMNDIGSGTNELIRHVFLLILLAKYLQFDSLPYLFGLFVVHTVSMLLPLKMPWLLRSMATTIPTITLVNLALLAAWMLPVITPYVTAAFIGAYLSSVISAIVKRPSSAQV